MNQIYKLSIKLFSIFFTTLFLFSACNSDSSTNHDHHNHNNDSTSGSTEMVDALKTLVANGNPMDYYHWNGKRAEFFRNQMEQAPSNMQMQLWFKHCEELLNSGNYTLCINTIEAFFQQQNTTAEAFLNNGTVPIVELLALAYLRKGEIENCQQNHSEYSCIVPLNEKAFHSLPTGSQKSIELHSLLQSKYPKEKYKWLINLAYMTLGQHPKGVPSNLLIKYPHDKATVTNTPVFKERAIGLGISENGLSGGVCTEDFNNDGWVDIFATSYGMSDQVKLFLNSTEGFKDVTSEAGLNGITSGLNCIHADYNNDGFEDIFILRGAWLGRAGTHPNSLLKNNGDGTFTDVTYQSGILSTHPTQTASWADVNKDGFLDLFIGNETKQDDSHPCELFINQKNGTFKEESAAYNLSGITGFIKGVSFGDINNDQWPDLYISVMGGDNMLFKNKQGKFVNVSNEARTTKPFFSFPCWFWDVNNDGYDDIFVSSYDTRNLRNLADDYAKEIQGKAVASDKSVLYINDGNGKFSESSVNFKIDKAMYAMGANYGDLDNDGWLDFYIGTGAPDFSTVIPNRMFKNMGGQSFEEVTATSRVGHIQKGHGISFADFDNDGDQDIYAVMGGAFEGDEFTNVYFENPTSSNNWVVFDLEGSKSNKSAIGTRLKLELSDGRNIFHTISTGGSFGSNSLDAELGLGQADMITKLEISWQNSEKQVFENIAINKKYSIKEGDNSITTIDYQKLDLKDGESGHQHHHH